MARPTTYDRQTSFRLYSAENPGKAHDGASLDTEFNAVKLALDETQSNLGLIQDTDGKVKRGSIGRAQLDSSVTLGVAPPASWATATAYDADTSVVFRNLVLYLCVVSHTSGVFQDDLNAGKWLAIADFSSASSVDDGSITTVKLADGAVTAAKLGNAAVSTNKILDSNITTSKLADSAVTTAKVAANAITTDKVDASVWSTGDVKITLKAAADAGWLMMDDGTIGPAGSGATHTGDSYQALFNLLFANVTDTYAPILTSAGAGTTRAAQTSAAAAWAAGCRLSLTKVLGRTMAFAGAGSGLTSRALGQTLGEETHILTAAESAALTFTTNIADNRTWSFTLDKFGVSASGGNAAMFDSGGSSTKAVTATGSITATTTSNAGGGAHNNMQPTSFFNIMVKL